MKLSNLAGEALHEIASYLRSVSQTRDRAIREVPQAGEGSALRVSAATLKDPLIVGFYQLTEWIDGLLEIADECDRLVLESEREVLTKTMSKGRYADSVRLVDRATFPDDFLGEKGIVAGTYNAVGATGWLRFDFASRSLFYRAPDNEEGAGVVFDGPAFYTLRSKCEDFFISVDVNKMPSSDCRGALQFFIGDPVDIAAQIAAIRREHVEVEKSYDRGLSGSEANEAHRNRGVLLDINTSQAIELEALTKYAAAVEVSRDMERAEVARLKLLAEQANEHAAVLLAERDALRIQLVSEQKLCADNASAAQWLKSELEQARRENQQLWSHMTQIESALGIEGFRAGEAEEEILPRIERLKSAISTYENSSDGAEENSVEALLKEHPYLSQVDRATINSLLSALRRERAEKEAHREKIASLEVTIDSMSKSRAYDLIRADEVRKHGAAWYVKAMERGKEVAALEAKIGVLEKELSQLGRINQSIAPDLVAIEQTHRSFGKVMLSTADYEIAHHHRGELLQVLKLEAQRRLILLEKLEAAQKALAESERLHGEDIDKRDRYEDTIAQVAAELGCEDEWSSSHDHAVCVKELVTQRMRELKEATERAQVHAIQRDNRNKEIDRIRAELAQVRSYLEMSDRDLAARGGQIPVLEEVIAEERRQRAIADEAGRRWARLVSECQIALGCDINPDMEDKTELNRLLREYRAAMPAKIAELRQEVTASDQIITAYRRVLDACPDCKAHGPGCAPHAAEWVRNMRVRLGLCESIVEAVREWQDAEKVVRRGNGIRRDDPREIRRSGAQRHVLEIAMPPKEMP